MRLGKIAEGLGNISPMLVPRVGESNYSSLLDNIKEFTDLTQQDSLNEADRSKVAAVAQKIYSAVEYTKDKTTDKFTPETFMRFMRTLDALNHRGFYHGAYNNNKEHIDELQQGSLSDTEYQKLKENIVEFLGLLDLLSEQKGLSGDDLKRAQALNDEIQRLIMV